MRGIKTIVGLTRCRGMDGARTNNQHKGCCLACQKRDNIYSKLWAADSCVSRWWGGCRWCFSWLWSNHLEDHGQEMTRPRPSNYMCALVQKWLKLSLEYSFSSFWLLCSITKNHSLLLSTLPLPGSVVWLSTLMCKFNMSPAQYLQNSCFR